LLALVAAALESAEAGLALRTWLLFWAETVTLLRTSEAAKSDLDCVGSQAENTAKRNDLLC
jgi:hypothetical protein